jgi:hypothetical protein
MFLILIPTTVVVTWRNCRFGHTLRSTFCLLGLWLAQPPGLSLTGRCPMPTTIPSAALAPAARCSRIPGGWRWQDSSRDTAAWPLPRGVSSFLVREPGQRSRRLTIVGAPRPARQAGPSRLGRPAVLAGPVAVAVRVHRRRPGPPSGSPPRRPPQLGLRARRAQTSTRRALKPAGRGRAVFPELPVAALCATLALQGRNRNRARRPSPIPSARWLGTFGSFRVGRAVATLMV